jgi:acetyl esterase
MRVVSVSAARGVALAALLVVGFVLAGCAPQPPAATSAVHSVRHVLAKRAVAAPVQVTVLPDIPYSTVGGMTERLDICMPTAAAATPLTFRPAIVAIHGGSWMEGDKAEPQWRRECLWLASAGYVVADVDYRLAPRYHFPDELTDVETAVQWMRAPAQTKRFGIDPTLIGAFGGSAGGNLVSMLGTVGRGALDRGHRVAAVVELSGPADLTARAPEADVLRPRVLSYLGCASYANCPQAVAASPIDNIDATDSPFLILQSTNELIPLGQSVSFANRLRAARVPVTLVTVPGTLHSIAMLTPTLRVRIIDFYRSVLVHHDPASATS